MEYLHMESLNDTPSESVIEDAVNAWTLTKTEHTSLLKHICENIVDKYIPFMYQDKYKPSCDQVRTYIIM